jgi:hypothetical protein
VPKQNFSETQHASSISSQGRGPTSDLGTGQNLRAAFRSPSCMAAISIYIPSHAKGTTDSCRGSWVQAHTRARCFENHKM